MPYLCASFLSFIFYLSYLFLLLLVKHFLKQFQLFIHYYVHVHDYAHHDDDHIFRDHVRAHDVHHDCVLHDHDVRVHGYILNLHVHVRDHDRGCVHVRDHVNDYVLHDQLKSYL